MTLRHIYEPRAYRFGAPNGSYWERTVVPPRCEAVTGDVTADVVIIGAGYTGLSAALHLARDYGIKALVLEAGQPGWGASGRNGGFCCMGGAAAPDAVLARRFGPRAAQDWTRTMAEAVYLVAELLDRHNIDAEVQPGGEVCVAHSPRAFAALRREAVRLERTLRVPVEVIDAQALAGLGITQTGAYGAVQSPIGFGLNPLKYALGLMRAATIAGADIRGHSKVDQIQARPGGGVTLRVNGFRVEAERLILATNGYSAENLPDWMRGRYLPALSSIMVTRPLTEAERSAQGWDNRVPCYDSRNLLHYYRLLPDNRMLLGARGAFRATPQAEAALARRLRRDFAAMFPAWRDVEASHLWNGFVCLTRGLVPYIGPIGGMPGAWAGFGWHGNGVAMGTYAGQLLAGLAAGDTPPVPRVAQTPPAVIAPPGLRRWTLPLAYGWKALQDRL